MAEDEVTSRADDELSSARRPPEERARGVAGAPRSWRSGGVRLALRHQARVLVLVYLVIAGAWIALSDRALGAIVSDPNVLMQISVYKGFVFVSVTTLLLYLLLRRAVGTIEGAFGALERESEARREHEEKRRAAEEIVEFAQDAILSHDFDGKITSWNPAAERIFGYPAAEVIGRSVELLSPPGASDPKKRRILDRLRRGERVEQFETERVRADGAKLAVSITFSPIWERQPGPSGEREIVAVSKIVRDISERRRAEEAAAREHEFADSLVESLPGIFYLFDEGGRFIRWNRNFERVSGYAADEIRELTPVDLFAASEQEFVRERIQIAFEVGESSVEASLLSKDGAVTPHVFTGRRVDFGGVTSLIGVGVDISARRQAEAALRELNERLELEVEERTLDLETALERAEAADRIKSAFLATMSHELRTPLNSIIGFTGIVIQELAGPLNDEQKKQLGMVRGSARHLLSLINDVLDISKIEAGQLEVRAEPFEPLDSIERVVESARPLAEEKGLSLTLVVEGDLGSMRSDPRRVEQILLNLVGNAIKFTDEGQVEIRAGRVEGAERPALRLRVRDTGIGIRADDLALLFQPFQQVDVGLERQHEGTGLGLAICRRLADLLGGTIGVESVWGDGSVFTVTLPMSAAET